MLLPEYNACRLAAGITDTLGIKQALDPSLLSELIQPGLSLVCGRKRELTDAYIMMKRSSGEIEMLESEMDTTMHYYVSKQKSIESAISVFSRRKDVFAQGAIVLLQSMRENIDKQVALCQKMFSVKQPTSLCSSEALDIEIETESECDSISSDSDMYSSDED